MILDDFERPIRSVTLAEINEISGA